MKATNEAQAAKGANVVAARIRAGLERKDVAKRVGKSVTSIWRVENGLVELTPSWVEKLARAIGCSPKDLMPETTQVYPGIVEVRKYAAGEGRVHPMEGAVPAISLEVTILSDRLVGIIVNTDDCWPLYRRGDIVFYKPNEQSPDAFIGRDCIVTTKAGSTFIRGLEAGTREGVFRLVSPRFPELLDVRVSWAAPILWVKRADPSSPVG